MDNKTMEKSGFTVLPGKVPVLAGAPTHAALELTVTLQVSIHSCLYSHSLHVVLTAHGMVNFPPCSCTGPHNCFQMRQQQVYLVFFQYGLLVSCADCKGDH